MPDQTSTSIQDYQARLDAIDQKLAALNAEKSNPATSYQQQKRDGNLINQYQTARDNTAALLARAQADSSYLSSSESARLRFLSFHPGSEGAVVNDYLYPQKTQQKEQLRSQLVTEIGFTPEQASHISVPEANRLLGLQRAANNFQNYPPKYKETQTTQYTITVGGQTMQVDKAIYDKYQAGGFGSTPRTQSPTVFSTSPTASGEYFNLSGQTFTLPESPISLPSGLQQPKTYAGTISAAPSYSPPPEKYTTIQKGLAHIGLIRQPNTFYNPGPTRQALTQVKEGALDIPRSIYKDPLGTIGTGAGIAALTATGIGAGVAATIAFTGQNVLEASTGSETTFQQIIQQPPARTAGQLTGIWLIGEGGKIGLDLLTPKEEVTTVNLRNEPISSERKSGWVNNKPRNTGTQRMPEQRPSYLQNRPEQIGFLKQGRDVNVVNFVQQQVPVGKNPVTLTKPMTEYVEQPLPQVKGVSVKTYGPDIVLETKLARSGEGNIPAPKVRPPSGSQVLTDVRRAGNNFPEGVVQVKNTGAQSGSPYRSPTAPPSPTPSGGASSLLSINIEKTPQTKFPSRAALEAKTAAQTDLPLTGKNLFPNYGKTTFTNPVTGEKTTYAITEEPVSTPPQNMGGFRAGMREKLFGQLAQAKADRMNSLPMNQPVPGAVKTTFTTEVSIIPNNFPRTYTLAFPLTSNSIVSQPAILQQPKPFTSLANPQITQPASALSTDVTPITAQANIVTQRQAVATDNLQVTTQAFTFQSPRRIKNPQPSSPEEKRPVIEIVPNLPPSRPSRPALGRSSPKEPETPPPIQPYKTSNQRFVNKSLFNVEVRRRGKFGRLNTQPLSLGAATRAGELNVRETAAASFRVVPVGGVKPVALVGLGRGFGESKRSPGVYVQAARFRISTGGEKREITVKGIAASKGRAATRRFKKRRFGGLRL